MFFFFFNDTATTEIYTLSLHDALPILCAVDMVEATDCRPSRGPTSLMSTSKRWEDMGSCIRWWVSMVADSPVDIRSEEHTSELQSQSNLVCRLLLEKKKTHCSQSSDVV